MGGRAPGAPPLDPPMIMMEICQYEIVENCDMLIKVRSELSRINLGHVAHITKIRGEIGAGEP